MSPECSDTGVVQAVSSVRVRKAYFDCRYGQLHVRTAFPASGGFDEKTTLVCLHPAGSSSRIFAPLLPVLAQDRSIYAPDAPGSGESDGAGGADGAYALALADFLDSLRLRQVDLLAVGDGAATAVMFARARKELVRRQVELPASDLMLLATPDQAFIDRIRRQLT